MVKRCVSLGVLSALCLALAAAVRGWPVSDPTAVAANGLKASTQRYKIFYASGVNPGTPGSWTQATEVQFETLTEKTGPHPSECHLVEYVLGPGGVHKAEFAIPPNSENALTGSGATGPTFCGLHLTRGTLIRVQAERLGTPNTYDEAFLGVVTDMTLDIGKEELRYTAMDYRYYMDRTALYGRNTWAIIGEGEFGVVFNRAARTIFNENGQPDRAQDGTDLTVAGDNRAWIKPRYNRDDSTPAGAPIAPAFLWADYWTLGHVWNYVRELYGETGLGPTGIAYNNCAAFINTWPSAAPGVQLEYLFDDGGSPAQRRLIVDFDVTGMSLSTVLDAILKRAGPYEWTVRPATGDNIGKIDIIVFPIHEGTASMDLVWGDAGDSVAHAAPDVVDGQITRTQRHYFNRGLALGRRKVFEVTLDSSLGTPTLIPNWDTTNTAGHAQYEYCQAIGTETEENMEFRRVFLEWRAPEDMDWSTLFFGGAITQRLDRPALKQLLTWALDPTAATNAKPRVYLYPVLWRKDPVSADWLLMSSKVSLEILPDICGFRLGVEARKAHKPGPSEVEQAAWPSGTAYTWGLNSDTPVLNKFRITLAIEADEHILAELDSTVSGERALELFFDGGNSYRTAYRSKAYLPTVSAVPSIEGPFDAEAGSLFGSASPVTFLDDQPRLANTLKVKMDTRHTTNLEGSLTVHGLRPGLVGKLIGTLTVPALEGEDPEAQRTEIDLDACIRGAVLDREANTTMLYLNGF